MNPFVTGIVLVVLGACTETQGVKLTPQDDDEKTVEGEGDGECDRQWASEQYQQCFRQAPSPPSPQGSDVISPELLRESVTSFCSVKVQKTRECVLTWLDTERCPNRQQLTSDLLNTGGLCDDHGQPAHWMKHYIWPQLGEWRVGECGLMDAPLMFCRQHLNIHGAETTTQEMDAVIGCIVGHMDQIEADCDRVVALYIMMIRITHFPHLGVRPSAQTLESLQNVTFRE